MTGDEVRMVRKIRAWALENGWKRVRWDDGTSEWRDQNDNAVIFLRGERTINVAVDNEIMKADLEADSAQLVIDTLAGMALIPPQFSTTYASGQMGTNGRQQVWQMYGWTA